MIMCIVRKRIINISCLFTVSASLIAFPLAGFAQQQGFDPSVEVNLVKDSNIYRSVEKVSDTIVSIAPKFLYNGLYGKQNLRAQYKGNYDFFQDNSNLNYVDHDVLLTALLDHSYKLTSELSIRYEDRIEQPGTNTAVSDRSSSFNEISKTHLTAKVAYGSRQSAGQVVVRYDQNMNRFDNNQQEFRDYDQDKLTGTFFYRVAPKTRLLLEASASNIDYKNIQNFDFSSKQYFYLAGVEWSATTITSSVFKIGYQNRDYDNASFTSLTGLSYFLDFYWRPNTFTEVKISGSRQAKEGAELSIGGFISNDFGIGLKHGFTERLKLTADYSYSGYAYDNSQDRDDTYQNASVRINYQAKNWLSLHLGVKQMRRDSSLDIYKFDATIISIGTVISID